MKKVRTFLKNFSKQPKKIQLAFTAMAALALVTTLSATILLITTDPHPLKALVLFMCVGFSIYFIDWGIKVVGDGIINEPK